MTRALDRLVGERVTEVNYRGFRLPAYTTDIAAAWQVVERMKSLGFSTEIYDVEEHWEVLFARGDDGGIARTSIALAIILAALRARGVTEDEIQAAMEGER